MNYVTEFQCYLNVLYKLPCQNKICNKIIKNVIDSSAEASFPLLSKYMDKTSLDIVHHQRDQNEFDVFKQLCKAQGYELCYCSRDCLLVFVFELIRKEYKLMIWGN